MKKWTISQLFKRKLLFVFTILALISLNIFLLSKISFIFGPISIVIKTVMFPILLAGVFYYVFSPIVDWAEKRNINRGVTTAFIFISLICGIGIILEFVIPTIVRQVKELVEILPDWWGKSKEFIDLWHGPSWTMDMMNQLSEFMNEAPSMIMSNGSDWMLNIGTEIFPIVESAVGIGAVLVTTPFVLFYLLKDGKKFPPYFLQIIPPVYRNRTQIMLHQMNQQISSYIRGQIIVSFCIGVLLYIGYLIIDLPYALTLAIIASLTSVVPYLGPIIAITPAICLALFTSPVLLIKIGIVWIVVQTLEGKLITPQIMGKSIKVHPLTIIFTILCAGKIFGVLGMVIAIPGYAVLKVVVINFFEWLKNKTTLYDEKEVNSKND